MAEQKVLCAGQVESDEVELGVRKVHVMQLCFLILRQDGFDITRAWFC